jgi:phosphatidylserine/phosphatidylglycerophosphate/cardiolipin synthase-like enzyme
MGRQAGESVSPGYANEWLSHHASQSDFVIFQLLEDNKANGNVAILRHPNAAEAIRWSHHNKMVVVDYAVAFVGGLDLACEHVHSASFWLIAS